MNSDAYLRAAIEQARKSLSEGGIPIGSVLVHEGEIIGRGHNCRVQTRQRDRSWRDELPAQRRAVRRQCVPQ